MYCIIPYAHLLKLNKKKKTTKKKRMNKNGEQKSHKKRPPLTMGAERSHNTTHRNSELYGFQEMVICERIFHIPIIH
jgi:hypothetical protein